jgi:hypothetical protein
MMAAGVLGFFYRPTWMVQHDALTWRALLAAVAIGFAIALVDFVVVRLRKSARMLGKLERSQTSNAREVAVAG